jgi:hypothetical protein
MDLGITPFDHLAVHPDFAVAVFHGGGCCGHGLILVVSVEVIKKAGCAWQPGPKN